MSGRPLGSAGGGCEEHAQPMPRQSALANPPRPGVDGWGADSGNTCSADAGRTHRRAVPRLKLKWAFGYPAGNPPTDADGRLGTRLRRRRQRVHLSLCSEFARTGPENGSIVRNATIGQSRARAIRGVFGDGHANVFAVDAQNGKLLWKTKVDPHFVARITAGPSTTAGSSSVSSSEEFSRISRLSLLSARGAWWRSTPPRASKSENILPTAEALKTQANGVVLYKPAGGAVWNSPTIDPVRQAVTRDRRLDHRAVTQTTDGGWPWTSPPENFVVVTAHETTCSWAAGGRTAATRAFERWVRSGHRQLAGPRCIAEWRGVLMTERKRVKSSPVR